MKATFKRYMLYTLYIHRLSTRTLQHGKNITTPMHLCILYKKIVLFDATGYDNKITLTAIWWVDWFTKNVIQIFGIILLKYLSQFSCVTVWYPHRYTFFYFRNEWREKSQGLNPDRCNGSKHLGGYLVFTFSLGVITVLSSTFH